MKIVLFIVALMGGGADPVAVRDYDRADETLCVTDAQMAHDAGFDAYCEVVRDPQH